MKHFLLKVYIELRAKALNRPFDYLYYGEASLVPGMRVLVNFRNQILVGYVVAVFEISDLHAIDELREKKKTRYIEDILDAEPIMTEKMFAVISEFSERTCVPLIHMIQTALPPSLKPSLSSIKAPKKALEAFLALGNSNVLDFKLTPRQTQLYNRVRHGEIVLKSAESLSTVRTLIDKGLIKLDFREKDRLNLKSRTQEIVDSGYVILNEEQSNAVDMVLENKFNSYLLEGVTGSGKTEVYLELADRIAKDGLSTLIIVSEISLTPQMIMLCQKRFGDRVALLHSGLTASEKYDQYRKISRGEVSVIVGARSAIFAPVNLLGLIIIDEEHSSTYYQDTFPYYNVHDIASIIQEFSPRVKILLGSATPSLVSATRARKNVIGHVRLENRYNKMSLPEVEIVDMSNPLNFFGRTYFLSKQLVNALTDVLSRQEQSIILVNRRGFSSFLECEKCHGIVRCEKCNRSMKYHKSDNTLKCHACATSIPYPRFCPECGGDSFRNIGFGTETVEEELKRIFPDNSIARIDSGLLSNGKKSEKIIDNFAKGNIDILVGTQILSKGHDFSNVTLSAIVAGDVALSIPNFTATESVFNIIYQTIGRSGRGSKRGKAIIQTYNPSHYAIQSAATQNYNEFYEKEMLVRKISKFPPYWYLSLLHVYAKESTNINDFANEVLTLLRNELSVSAKDVIITGPYDPYVKFVGPYRKVNILLRYKDFSSIKRALLSVSEAGNSTSDTKIDIEINPIDLY